MSTWLIGPGKANAGSWILGHGWNQNSWSEGYGTAALLDEITLIIPRTSPTKACTVAGQIRLRSSRLELRATLPIRWVDESGVCSTVSRMGFYSNPQ